jgi:putative ABC transport system permease protein
VAPAPGPGTAVTVVVLVAVFAVAATGVLRLQGLPLARGVPGAAVRALLQLLAVAGLITAVLGSVPASLGLVAVMAGVATVTAARRVTRHRSGALLGVPVLIGPAALLAVLVLTGLVPWRGAALVPAAGILIGGAMTVTGQAGRLSANALRDSWDVWEQALALGLSRRTATLLVIRAPAGNALLPVLDQTRTVGVVTLPGTFVGLLLGGASPLVAAGAQLVVLVGLVLVEAVALGLTTEAVARGLIRIDPGQDRTRKDRTHQDRTHQDRDGAAAPGDAGAASTDPGPAGTAGTKTPGPGA